MAPILPGISDRPDQLREVACAAIDAGATHVSPILLHLRPGVREEFLPWLEKEHPDLVERYLQMYRQPYGPKAMRESLGRQVTALVADAGGVRRGVEPARRFFRRDRSRGPAERASEQLRLL
jgi:DNA repair photolyase